MIFFNLFKRLLVGTCSNHLAEPPQRGGSNEFPQSMFLIKNKKKIRYTPAYPSFAI